MAVVRMDHPPGNGLVGPSPEATPSRPPPLAQVDGVVFPFLGGFGRYQKRLVLLSWIPALLVSCNQFSDYMHLAQPNITCAGNATAAADPVAVPPLNGSTHTPFMTDNYEENEMECSCSDPHIQLEFGLKQNVITQVRMPDLGCYPWSSWPRHMRIALNPDQSALLQDYLRVVDLARLNQSPVSYMCKQEQNLGDG